MRSTLAQRLALILVGLVLGLAALELGLRGSAWIFLARQEWRNWASTAETAAPEFRILCIGESTTALGGDDAYPRQLEGLLDTPDVRRRIRVINKGIPAITTDGILGALPAWLETYHPDVVVAMIGINDPPDAALETVDTGSLRSALASLRIVKFATWVWQSWRVRRARKVALPTTSDADSHTLPRRPPPAPATEAALERAVATDPGDARARVELARRSGGRPERREYARSLLGEAIRIAPDDLQLQGDAAQVYFFLFDFEQATNVLERITSRGEPATALRDLLEASRLALAEQRIRERRLDDAKALLVRVAASPQRRFEGVYQSKRALLALARGDFGEFDGLRAGLATHWASSMTMRNYRALRVLLASRGIRLVAVQYPIRSVAPLGAVLADDPSVVFVDNEAVFRDALGQAPWETYFTDAFGGDFGHMTAAGNRLLAESVAGAIRTNFLDPRKP